MLSDTITLSVDDDGNGAGSAVSRDWTRYRTGADSSFFKGSGTENSPENTIKITRSERKRSGDINGFDRSTIKFTYMVNVDNAEGDGTVDLPLSAEIKFAVPVGATDAETLKLRQTLYAFLNPGSGFNAQVCDDLEI